jgi:hypothetical protein
LTPRTESAGLLRSKKGLDVKFSQKKKKGKKNNSGYLGEKNLQISKCQSGFYMEKRTSPFRALRAPNSQGGFTGASSGVKGYSKT